MNPIFAPQQIRLDGIQNLTTGIGVQAGLSMGLFSRPTLTREQQSRLLKYGFLRKIVSKLPKASTAKWGSPTIVDGDSETIAAIITALDKIKVLIPGELAVTGVKSAFYHALFNAFLTGNGAIVVHTIEKKDSGMDTPLDLKNLKQIRKLVVLDRWTIQPVVPIDMMEEIEYFQITGGAKVHASRVLWFEGEKLDQWGKQVNSGCDESILDGIASIFEQYIGGIAGVAETLRNFSVIDIGIEGLWDLTKDQAQVMRVRSQANLELQETMKARIRDKDKEIITRETRNVSGISDLMGMLKDWMLANTDYPPAVLFGEFSTGLGASGKTQEERALWNDTIADLQSNRLTHQITGRHADAPGLLDILCACADGPTKGKVPNGLGWMWNPLYVPSPTEQADLEMNRAQMAMTIGGGDPASPFVSNYLYGAYGGNVYSPNITLTTEYKKLLQDQAALVPPPAPETDEYGNPIGTEYEETPTEGEAEPTPEEPQTDSADDPIDRMVRDSVRKGIKLFNVSRTLGDGRVLDRWMLEFADGAELDSDDLIKWRSFWRDSKPKTELGKMLHGGNWGKVWGNRV